MKKIRKVITYLFALLTLFICSCNTHEHTFEGEWEYDELRHYKWCECGQEELFEYHTYNTTITKEATHLEKGSKTYTCSVCGYSYTVDIDKIETHTYNKQVIDNKYLRSEATYDEPATYYYSCECGECGNEYFSFGDKLEVSLANKNIYFIGDSITCGVGASSNDNCFVSKVGSLSGCNAYNLGISGSSLCLNGRLYSSYVNLNENSLTNADIVVICLGVNDWQCASNKPSTNEVYYGLGNMNSNDPSTIYGALKLYCDTILELKSKDEFKDTTFVFATPLVTKRNSSAVDANLSYLRNGTENFSDYKTCPFGYTYLDELDAFYDVTSYYDIPLIDTHYTSGIYYYSESYNNANSLMPDGIHPNDKGHLMIADAIIDGLKDVLTRNYTYKVRATNSTDNITYDSNNNILVNGDKSLIDLTSVNLANQQVNHNTTDAIWIPNIHYNGYFNTIDYIAAQGVTNFYKVKIEDNNIVYYHLIKSEYNDAGDEGLIKTLTIDENLNDEYIAISGSFYWNPNEDYYKSYTYNINPDYYYGLNPQTFFFNVRYDVNTRIDELDFYSKNRQDEIVLYKHNMNESNSDFIGNVSNYQDDGITITSRVVLNRYYALADRTIIYNVYFNEDTIAYFETTENKASASSYLMIDVANHIIKTNSSEKRKLDILVGKGYYEIRISKYYQKYIVEIYKGDESFTTYFENDSSGGVGSGAVNYSGYYTPMQWDYYSLSSANSFILYDITITTSYYDMVMYGDSITEPESYYPANAYDNSWTRLITKAMEEHGNTAINSGRGGTSINQIAERIRNELPYIKPKYCMITVGTNGGVTEANLTELVKYIKSLGVTPIINHIPCYNHVGDESSYKNVNAIIDIVREKENVTGINFDEVTTINDGCDESLMWKEDYGNNVIYYHHPNNLGAFYMYLKSVEDVPFIYNLNNNS